MAAVAIETVAMATFFISTVDATLLRMATLL